MSLAFRSRSGASALRAAARSLSASTTSSSPSATPAIASSHRPIIAPSPSWTAPSRPFSASTLHRAAADASAHEIEHTIDNPPPRQTTGHLHKSRYNASGVMPTHEEIIARLAPAEKQQLDQMQAEADTLMQKLQRLQISENEATKKFEELLDTRADLKSKIEDIYYKILVQKNPQLDHDHHHDDHHHEEFNPNRGWLFGVKPGEKREREGWEVPMMFATASVAIFAVVLMFQPNHTLDTWALEEARRRLEKEGILEDPYPSK